MSSPPGNSTTPSPENPESPPSPENSESPPSPETSDSPPPPEQSEPPPSPEKSEPPPSPEKSEPPPSPEKSEPPPSPKAPPPPESSKTSSPPPPTKASDSSPPPPKTSPNSPPLTPTPTSSNSSPPPPPKSSNNNNTLAPPPPKSSPSPPKSSSSNHKTSSSTNSNDISEESLKLIIGVCVGVGLFIILTIILCVAMCRKKKKGRPYYGDYRDGSQYYPNTSNHPKWHNNQAIAADHMMRMSQPPGRMGSSPGWPNQNPNGPPMGMMMSGEMSTDFSGANRPVLPPPSPGYSVGMNQSMFSYDELAAATGGFSEANVLGQGGFGYVHKGVLSNGKEVAVKSLKSGSGQGEREFQAEVEIISRVHHKHLVSLVGYCIAGGQRLLVYEFVPNNTLEHHLHGKDLPVMDFATRLRIALGSAKGLAYLHEDCHPRIIHRDIKSANILLDFNFEAMVADFGLAKLSSDNYTHVSTRVMGTFGYLAPEYASSGKLTEKSDVFSFGIMLLEIITGKKPVDPLNMMEDSLVDWARPLLSQSLDEGKASSELIDSRLENNYNREEMQRMIACAAASIRHSARKRPKMSQIVRALEGDVSLDALNEGVKPGQSAIFTSSGETTEYNATSYNADMKRFRQVALSSQEFGSSDSHEMSPTDFRKDRF